MICSSVYKYNSLPRGHHSANQLTLITYYYFIDESIIHSEMIQEDSGNNVVLTLKLSTNSSLTPNSLS